MAVLDAPPDTLTRTRDNERLSDKFGIVTVVGDTMPVRRAYGPMTWDDARVRVRRLSPHLRARLVYWHDASDLPT
jgi:hypothetical protein